MKPFIKHIEHGVPLSLADQVDYLAGQVVSMTLTQNKHRSLTLFAFDRGEEISTHASHGDAMVTILDGVGQVTIGNTAHVLTEGETIVMPADVPHAVYAQERFKMLLTVIFPEEAGEPIL